MPDPAPRISVILATYNGRRQLDVCLTRLLEVADTGVEVVIADDGSSHPETFEIIERHARHARVPVKHAWQEDVGFRLARSRNNAVRIAEGSFFLFLDHDILLPKPFFSCLRACLRPGWFVGGRRVKLDQATSDAVLSGATPPARLFTPVFILHAYRRKLPGRRFLLPLRDRRPGTSPQPFRGMSGFCIGAWRDDFEAIDGFDARYQGYGVEDWDFMARLQNHGVHAGYLPRLATTLHLWHRETPHDTEGPGYQMLREIEAQGVTRAREGYSAIAQTTPQPQGTRS